MFQETATLFYKVVVPFYLPGNVLEFQLQYIFAIKQYARHFNGYVMVSDCGSNLYFPND